MARNKKVTGAIQGHRTKEELEEREEQEKKMLGNSDNVKCPTWLSKEAKKEFKRVCKELLDLNIIGNIDTTILAIYADAYDNYVKLTKFIQEDGAVIEHTNTQGATNKVVSPNVLAQQKYIETIMKCSSKLGLSISDRLRLIVPKAEDKPKNKFNEFMD